MLRLTTLTGCVILLAAFLVGTGRSGEKGSAQPKKVYLPKYWSRLGLSDGQKKKVIEIRADYQTKIQKLKEQISKLTREEQTATAAQLTEEQKDRLRKIITEKVGGSAIEKPAATKKSPEKKGSKE